MCGRLKDKIKETDENILVWVVRYGDSNERKLLKKCYSIIGNHTWEFSKLTLDRRFSDWFLLKDINEKIEAGMFHSFKSVKKARKLSKELYGSIVLPAVIPKGSYYAPIINDVAGNWEVANKSHGYVTNQLILFKTLPEAKEYMEVNSAQ